MTLPGRDAYRAELTALAETDERIICLEADLGGKKHPFAEAHPDRFFNIGIAEGAMVDMAVGLAAAGYRPFISTFAPFAALRATESLKLALGYIGAPITVVAPYAGVSGAWFGTTHHSLEDIGIVRTVPGVAIAAPHGEADMRAVVRHALETGRPHYIRTGRNAAYESLPGDAAGPGEVKWAARRPGGACLVSVGEEAARLCGEAESGLSHAVLTYVDNESLRTAAKELSRHHSTLIVVEEHRTAGSAAEALALLLPEAEVHSVSAGDQWPAQGGDHAETLAQVGLHPAALAAKTAETA
ncbi:transketolase family protein [Salininema proteolyticum]|uniref:Transketolase n=1 Tax=Salininema proteolyticum TaxID=1607685 RepID=A0ABV8TU47_9ACTN